MLRKNPVREERNSHFQMGVPKSDEDSHLEMGVTYFLRPILIALLCLTSAAFAQDNGDSQIDFANGLLQRGFFKDAAKEYTVYLEKYPQAPHVPTALYRLGESQYALNDYEAALKTFDKFLAQQAGPELLPRVQLRRGEVLYRLKKLDEAMAALEPLTKPETAPAVRPSALYYMGKAAYDAGKLDQAHAAFKELAEKHSDDALAPYGRFQLGYVLLAREESENAAIEFSNVAGAENADPALRAESRYLAAETYDKLGWYEPAVKAYQQLKQDFPDSEFARKADYGYAWALFHAGKLDEASKAADALLKAQPEGDAAVGLKYLQASCLQQQKQYEPAIALYRELASKHAGTEFAERARYKIPWTLYLAGDIPGAKAELTHFLELNQNERYAGEAAFLLGSILLAEQNYVDACTQFTLIAERFPGSEFAADALFKAGECRTKLAQPAEAAKAFEDFATRYPDHALAGEAILRAGDAQFSAAAFEQAVQKYKKLLEKPADPAVEEETLYRLAVTYHNMRDYKSSSDTFRALAEKFPQGAHVAEAQLRNGDYQLYEARDPVKAIQSYEAAQKADANNTLGGRALKGLALARYESKDYDGAAELLLKLIADQPDVDVGEKIYAWVGQRMYDVKKWDEASQAFAALLKLHPDYANADAVRLQLGLAKEAAGKSDEALAVFDQLAQQPDSPYAAQAKYHLAKAYDAKKEADKAAKLYEEIANSNSGDLAAEARFRLGELAEANDDPKAASEHYMRVAILFLHEQLTPESLWRAGQCFEKLKNSDEARKAYEELVTTYPESEPSAKAQERLTELKAAPRS